MFSTRIENQGYNNIFNAESITQNLEIICEGYYCLATPKKIEKTNLHEYDLSFNIFDQQIKVNKSIFNNNHTLIYTN